MKRAWMLRVEVEVGAVGAIVVVRAGVTVDGTGLGRIVDLMREWG
jgi:hypothetical protein